MAGKLASLPKVVSQFKLGFFPLVAMGLSPGCQPARQIFCHMPDSIVHSRKDVIGVCNSPPHIVLKLTEYQPLAILLLC